MILLYFVISYIINPTKIFLNIEKPNKFITHTGITFKNNNQEIRYDFRAFNDNRDYITTIETRKNISQIFPGLNKKIIQCIGWNKHKEIEFYYCKDIYLGTSNYSIYEIYKLEKKLHKKYILGIYDCRHYVRNITDWACNNPTPVWDLYKFF